MTFDTSKLSDEQFIFAYLVDHIDEELDGPNKERFQKVMASDAHRGTVEGYHDALGQLQLQMQGYYVGGERLAELHDLIETSDIRKTNEMQKIEEVDRSEMFVHIRRRLIIFGLVAAAVVVSLYQLTPRRERPFEALEVIAYEAGAMMEEPGERLTIASEDLDEIAEYFSRAPDLGFTPRILRPGDDQWVARGAAIIDYDRVKVSVVQYESTKSRESVFHFALPGNLNQLPPSDPGNFRGLIYQTYASDLFNIVAWRQTPDATGFIIGRLSAPELASFAHDGSARP